MTDHPRSYETELDFSAPERPELSIVGDQPEVDKFDDFTFDLSRHQFVEIEGSSLEVNDATRTMHVFRILNDAFPDLQYPEGRERERKISSVRSYLGQTALVANPKKAEDPKNYHEPHKVKISKHDYTKEALNNVLTALEEENHPTHQILSQIEKQFGKEMKLGPTNSLKRNVIFAAHHKAFKNEVADLINRDRQVD